MKNIKRILILLIIVILTGCSVNVNVTMNESGGISEEVDVLTPSSLISDKKDRIDSYLTTAIKSYMPAFERRNYTSSIINNPKGDSGVKLTNSHDNICKYIENNIFSQYVYKNIRCTDNDGYYEIKNITDHIKYCDYCIDRPSAENINLKITLPIKAEESDADEVNGNTYIWKYDKYTDDSKTFYLKINKEKLRKNEVKLKKQNKFKNIGLRIVISVVIIVFALIIFSKLYKKYKNNNLEY